MALRPVVRQDLHARPDVPDEDVDDIIEIAARRQDAARQEARATASRAELAAVAEELDIAPEHVEGAIAELRAQRAAAAKAARAAAVEQSRMRTVGVAALAGMLAIGAVTGVGVTGAAWLGAGPVREAAAAAHAAEARLDAVLERQASLAPQLAGLAGAQGAELSTLAAAVRDAPDIAARLDAADALSVGMATRLGQLPPPSTDAEATLRLQLNDEVTGSQNRVSTELRRYREAEAAWGAAADGTFGGLAVTFGFAEGPPAGR